MLGLEGGRIVLGMGERRHDDRGIVHHAGDHFVDRVDVEFGLVALDVDDDVGAGVAARDFGDTVGARSAAECGALDHALEALRRRDDPFVVGGNDHALDAANPLGAAPTRARSSGLAPQLGERLARKARRAVASRDHHQHAGVGQGS